MLNIGIYFLRNEMKLNKCLFPAIIILALFRPGVAQQYEVPCISEKYLEQHVSYLASDSLQGRSFFTENPGLELAADYINTNIEFMAPGFPGESYFQSFNLIANRLDKNKTFIKVFNKKKKEQVRLTEFTVWNQESEVIDFSGEINFVGFGWKDEKTGYNDFTGVELKDKIVILSAGTPESFKEGFSQQWNNRQERKKTEEIFKAGAKAIILVTSTQDADNKTFSQIWNWAERPRFSLIGTQKKEQSNLVITTPDVADAILGRKGKWEKLLVKISKEEKANSFELPNRSIQVQSVRTVETIEARNIVGIVEGTDSEVKDECVVFMAHYDHLGVHDNGEIYNGADDNASGAAVMLEVARVFSELIEKPRRSIVFLWVTAEEVGLLGSEYYSKNPVFPLHKTVACINLDMVGRVYQPRDSVWNHSPKRVKNFNEIYVLANDYNPALKEINDMACEQLGLQPDYSLPNNFFYSSDHYHFHRNEVPILNFSTGYTADYHRTTDTSDRIRYDKMKKVAELCVLVGMAIANE